MMLDVNTQVSEFAEIFLGYAFRGAIEEYPMGTLSVLQAKNLDSLGELSHVFVKTALNKTRGRLLLQNGDVLLTNRGTFRSGVYWGEDKNLIASSSVYIIRIKDQDKVLPEYLSIFLNSKIGQAQLESINSGTLIRSLPKGDLVNLRVPIPSLKDQQKIIDIYQNHRARSTLYEKKAKIHKTLADFAIYKLITS